MAKIGVKIGFTLRLTQKEDFQFVRPEVEISDIDTEKNVEEQLELVRKVMDPTWAEMMLQVDKKVMQEMPNVSKEMEANVMKQLKAFKVQLDSVIAQLPVVGQ